VKLVRHKKDKFHKILGFGMVLEDYGYKVLIKWINPKSTKYRQHIMIKKALIFLDPNEEDCTVMPNIKWDK